MFGILFVYCINEKVKMRAVGKTLSLLTLFVSIGKFLAERISKEQGVSPAEAENIVVDCIKDGIKTVVN
ncbi:MAG: hypothetical protein HFI29_05300 [Lachnospiraceae bacterium]|jgi:hypothetical protein|nr:hypothetical protein [Lachnospiraceae bacterium]